MRKTIFLIGYMGCGKTTLGRALAARTGVRFIDLDDYIEERAGMTISGIFATKGESTFRAMEREALGTLVADGSGRDTVVACGGGTPCFGDNMQLMDSLGITVHLVTSEDRLFSRLAVARSHRPLIARLTDPELRDFIRRQLGERNRHYSKASATFDSTMLEDASQIEQTVTKFIDRFFK